MLSSCGTELSKTAHFNVDHSGVWEDNFYTRWDESLRNKETEQVTITEDENQVFTSFYDQHFLDLEPDHSLTYYDFDETSFGTHRNLALHDPLVNDGFVSKLFNGLLFCNGWYELARVQINEEGFSSSFYKPIQSADYLFLQFKSALDFKQHSPTAHYADITIHISLYGKRNVTYSFPLVNVITNASDGYTFFGFSLDGFDISGTTDFAITYTLDRDEYNEEKGTNISHALMLYEFGFGHPTF